MSVARGLSLPPDPLTPIFRVPTLLVPGKNPFKNFPTPRLLLVSYLSPYLTIFFIPEVCFLSEHLFCFFFFSKRFPFSLKVPSEDPNFRWVQRRFFFFFFFIPPPSVLTIITRDAPHPTFALCGGRQENPLFPPGLFSYRKAHSLPFREHDQWSRFHFFFSAPPR